MMPIVRYITQKAEEALLASGVYYERLDTDVYSFSDQIPCWNSTEIVQTFTLDAVEYCVIDQTLALTSENIVAKQTKNKIKDFQRGTIVRNKLSGTSYVIDINGGNYAIGIRTVRIDNPDEWEFVSE